MAGTAVLGISTLLVSLEPTHHCHFAYKYNGDNLGNCNEQKENQENDCPEREYRVSIAEAMLDRHSCAGPPAVPAATTPYAA